MTQKYGDGFKRPKDFFTGQPYGNHQANYGLSPYNDVTSGSRGRVEILPENEPNPQDRPHDAKVTDNAE